MNYEQLAAEFAALGFKQTGAVFVCDGIQFKVVGGQIRYQESINVAADIPPADLRATLRLLSPTYRMLDELRALLVQTRTIARDTAQTADFAKQAGRAINRAHEEVARLKSELASAYATIDALLGSSSMESSEN